MASKLYYGSVQFKMCPTTGKAHNVLDLGQSSLPIPHFVDMALAGPVHQGLTFIDKALARCGSPIPHLYRQGLGSQAPTAYLLLANPSLLLARPLTSIPSQTVPIPNHQGKCSAPNSKH